MNFSATMEVRGSSSIHRVYNDPGTATIKKCGNSGIEVSSRTKRALTAANRNADYHKKYAKRSEAVKHKLVVHSNKLRGLIGGFRLLRIFSVAISESSCLF